MLCLDSPPAPPAPLVSPGGKHSQTGRPVAWREDGAAGRSSFSPVSTPGPLTSISVNMAARLLCAKHCIRNNEHQGAAAGVYHISPRSSFNVNNISKTRSLNAKEISTAKRTTLENMNHFHVRLREKEEEVTKSVDPSLYRACCWTTVTSFPCDWVLLRCYQALAASRPARKGSPQVMLAHLPSSAGWTR